MPIAGIALLAAVVVAAVMACQIPMGGTAKVDSVTLNKPELGLIVGQSERLIPTVLPANAANKVVSWSILPEGFATVSPTGLVTASAAGSATVTVTTMDGSKTATCSVTVVNAPVLANSVSLNHESATMPYGATLQLAETVLPTDATNKAVAWSVLGGTSATVSDTGFVTTSGLGLTTIAATTVDGSDISAHCVVTVIPKVQLNHTSLELDVGHSELLVATFDPAATPANTAVTWSTSDPNTAAVYEGFVLAIDAGSGAPRTATITATAVDGSNSATCEVTVSGTLGYDYDDVYPAILAIERGMEAAITSNDPTQTAYSEFDSASRMMTIHFAEFHPEGSVYEISGTIAATVSEGGSVGPVNGDVALVGVVDGTIVTRVVYVDAYFKSPRSGYVDITFSADHADGKTRRFDLVSGEVTVLVP